MTEWDRAYMKPRRHPRTLTEAFGPYTDNRVEPMRKPTRWEKHEMGALVVLLIVAIVIIWATR